MGSLLSKNSKTDTEEKTNNKKEEEKTTSNSQQQQDANKEDITVETNMFVAERQDTFTHFGDGTIKQETIFYESQSKTTTYINE